MLSFIWLCVLVSLVKISYGQYEIPPVTLEAYKPRGFRASIKADNLTELFAFHGKLNEKINQIEPGEFGEDVKSPVDGYFTYYNPNMELKVNDKIHYWVFVQHKKLGYRRDAQVWKVNELRNPPESECETSVTVVSDRTKVCRNMTIFEDQFGGSSIDISKWILEQYVPGKPDYEFVVYRPDKNVTFVDDGNLVVIPHLASDKDIEADPLDLTDGCTKTYTQDEPCLHKKFMLQNPVVSGRLVSKQSFTYADVEVNAKLPSGDWLYPEIYLEDDNQNRLIIAYARGNKVLTGNDNKDIGGALLFGGPMLSNREPKRSEKLSSTRINSGTFSDAFHTYRVRWSESAIELYVDGKNYGVISSESIKSSGFVGSSPKQTKISYMQWNWSQAGNWDGFLLDSRVVKPQNRSLGDLPDLQPRPAVGRTACICKVRLVLGVGVGGINDFPNGYKSGINDKPWIDRNTQQVKTFYANVNHWFPTWGSGGRLQVNYVKVTAL